MMKGEAPREVMIDGVRYVPAATLSPAIDDFRQALLDVWWGEGYRGDPKSDPEDGMFININDDNQGEPFKEFMEGLIAKLARTPLNRPEN